MTKISNNPHINGTVISSGSEKSLRFLVAGAFRMTKQFDNKWFCLIFEICYLEFDCHLVLEICDFRQTIKGLAI